MAWRFIWMWFVRLQRGGVALPLKMVNHVGDSCEAVYAAQFAVDAFMAEPIAHRGTRFNRFELDARGDEFLSHAHKHVGTLHVNKRRGGEIEHNELRRRRLRVNTAQDGVADIVDVEIDEGRFRPENHYFGDELVVVMSFAVRKATGPGN